MIINNKDNDNDKPPSSPSPSGFGARDANRNTKLDSDHRFVKLSQIELKDRQVIKAYACCNACCIIIIMLSLAIRLLKIARRPANKSAKKSEQKKQRKKGPLCRLHTEIRKNATSAAIRARARARAECQVRARARTRTTTRRVLPELCSSFFRTFASSSVSVPRLLLSLPLCLAASHYSMERWKFKFIPVRAYTQDASLARS